MRQIRFAFLFCAFVTVCACTHELTAPEDGVKDGEISVSLLYEGQELQSKASVLAELPSVGDLKVEIFKKEISGPVRLFRDIYANISEKKIPLNCADYRLFASYGDSLGVGFGKPYFAGSTDFTLERNESQIVETVVKVANVRVAVKYGDNLVYDYPEFHATVHTLTKGGRKSRSLKFYSDTDEAGFVPAGSLYFELYARIDGEWRYYRAPAVEALPGDDVVFTAETSRLESEAVFNLTVEQPGEVPKSYPLSEDFLPQDPPTVNTDAFTGSVFVVEGDKPVEDLKMDVVADGNIQDCWLSVESDYLAALGVPSEVNLADPEMDPAVRSVLEGVGLKWMKGMRGRRFAYVDFSGISRFLSRVSCDPDNMFAADFSLRVVDQRHNPDHTAHVGTVSTEKCSFMQGVPVPQISVSGFEDSPFVIMEGMGTSYDGLKAQLVAKGRIASCVLGISSPYMLAAGIPESVDLADVTPEIKSKLNSFGITWPDNLSSLTSAEIDFSGIDDYMDRSMYDASIGFDFASLSLTVSNSLFMGDEYEKAGSDVGSFRYTIPTAPSAENNYNELDVWARRIHGYSTVLADGNPEFWKLQYSTDGKSWTDMNATAEGSKLVCDVVRGLSSTAEAGVRHDVRAIYHDNPDIAYPLSSFTTEAAAQVKDAGFNTWQTKDFEYYLDKVWGMGGYNTSRKWYLPWTDETQKYWDVNSRKTMPSNTTPQYQDYKVFPAVSYSTDTPDGSSASAQMIGVYVCNMATSSSYGDDFWGTAGGLVGGVSQMVAKAAGNIFIGTATSGGDHASEGREFHSRPDKIRFQYRYKSYNNETYQVKAWIKDAEDEIIAEAGTDSGQHSDKWITAELPLTWYRTDVKAEKIYISFRSASCEDSAISYTKNVSVEMAGQNFKGHLGSILKIDNVELIYE